MSGVFYTRYNPPPSPSLKCDDVSRTSQDAKQECDINYIVARAGAGLIAPPTCPEPVFVDFSDVPDNYEEYLKVLMDAQARFDAMPSRVRERFGNDPAQLVAFLRDEKNRAEAERLGIVKVKQPVVDLPKDSPKADEPKDSPKDA